MTLPNPNQKPMGIALSRRKGLINDAEAVISSNWPRMKARIHPYAAGIFDEKVLDPWDLRPTGFATYKRPNLLFAQIRERLVPIAM